MVTGGVAPNTAGILLSAIKSIIFLRCLGRTVFGSGILHSEKDAKRHQVVTDAVHSLNGVIAMQILHTGRSVLFYFRFSKHLISFVKRYGYHFSAVSSSPIKAPIGMTTPKVCSTFYPI